MGARGKTPLELLDHARLLRLMLGLETVRLGPTLHVQRGKCLREGHKSMPTRQARRVWLVWS